MPLSLQIQQTDDAGNVIQKISYDAESGDRISFDFKLRITLNREGELPSRVAPIGEDIIVQWNDGSYIILEDSGEAAEVGDEVQPVSINGLLITTMGSDLDRSDIDEYLQWTASYEDSPLPWAPLPRNPFAEVEEREPEPVEDEQAESPSGEEDPPEEENLPPEVESGSANVSEEGLSPLGIPDTSPALLDTTDNRIFTGTLNVVDPEGDPLTITLHEPTVNLYSKGLPVEWSGDGTGTITGSVTFNGTTTPVIEINIDNDGNYKVTLLGPVDHGDPEIEDINSIDFGVDVSDGTNVTATVLRVNIEDDAPSIDIDIAGTPGALIADESFLGGSGSTDTANFAGNFTTVSSSYGADEGGSVSSVYALGIKTDSPTGLVDTMSGNAVVLSMTPAGVVEGRATSGELVFTLSGDGVGGVTLTQFRAVVHSPDNGPDQPTTLSAANLVTLTRTDTITDADGDSSTDSAVLDIGRALTFEDDAPSIIAPQGVTLANTTGASTMTDSVPGEPSLDTLDDNVDDNVGADQTGTVAFAVEDGEPAMGMIAASSVHLTSGGEEIHLYTVGNQLQGWTGGAPGESGATEIFTITLNHDATGVTSDSYSVELHQQIDNGAGFAFTDLTAAKAGHNDYYVLDGDAVTPEAVPLDLRLSSPHGAVNTTRTDIGIGNQQFDGGERMRVDFGEFSTSDGTGTLSSVNGAGFAVLQLQPTGNSAELTVSTFEGGAQDTITEIHVIRGGTTYSSLGGSLPGSLSFSSGGGASVEISGLLAGDQVVIFTSDGYDGLTIENTGEGKGGTRDADFQIGGLFVSSYDAGEDVSMNYPVVLIDADGDTTAEANLAINLSAVSPVGLDHDADDLEFMPLSEEPELDSKGEGALVSNPEELETPGGVGIAALNTDSDDDFEVAAGGDANIHEDVVDDVPSATGELGGEAADGTSLEGILFDDDDMELILPGGQTEESEKAEPGETEEIEDYDDGIAETNAAEVDLSMIGGSDDVELAEASVPEEMDTPPAI